MTQNTEIPEMNITHNSFYAMPIVITLVMGNCGNSTTAPCSLTHPARWANCNNYQNASMVDRLMARWLGKAVFKQGIHE